MKLVCIDMSIYEEIKDLNEHYLLEEEMANVSKEDTGLPYDLWVDSSGKDRATPRNEPRLKVVVDNQYIPITISDNPEIPEGVQKTLGITSFKDFTKVKKYIIAYKKILMAHYLRQLTDKQLLNLLRTALEAPQAEMEFNQITSNC